MPDQPEHTSTPTPWEKGLPPGPYYPGMEDEYEVYFTPGGWPWWRRRTATSQSGSRS